MKNPLRTTIDDVQYTELNQIFTEGSGAIVFCEKSATFPFSPKRVYYLYDVPNQAARGGHAHKELQQVLIAVSGAFEVVVNDGTDEKVFQLSQPNQGLYFPPGLWRELRGFSGGAICLVIASEAYLETDYIRVEEEFTNWKSHSYEV
jgi:hypothetical protein